MFHDFVDQAVRIDDADTTARANTAGDLSFKNNTWGAFGSSDGSASSLTKNGTPAEIAQLNTKGNAIEDPRLRGISRSSAGGLDPRPDLDSPLWTAARSEIPADGFFAGTDFRGAFGDENWATEWTPTRCDGLLQRPGTCCRHRRQRHRRHHDGHDLDEGQCLHPREADLRRRNGATLTIQPGTTIYGAEDSVNDTFGSLIITRGCKIDAVGTAADPIVFTALDERDFAR